MCSKKDVLTEELERLLAETVGAAIERERNAFDQAAGPLADRIVLFGAGGMGRRTLAGMRKAGISPLAFADNNPDAQGKELEGVPVLSPAEAASRYGTSAVFLVTIWGSFSKDRMQDRIRFLEQLGCKHVLPAGLLCWKFADQLLPYFPMDLPHKVLNHAAQVRAALDLFQDPQSRQEYLGQLRFRLLMDFDRMARPLGFDGYFQSDLFALNPNEVFVDCGAFDGDTIADFLRVRGTVFQEIIAFEPDRLNVEKIQDRLTKLDAGARQRISIQPYALGAERGVVQFSSSGSDQSKIGQGADTIDLISLDEALEEKNPTFIKFDIEGAEPQALAGAQQTIRRCRPVLAVSVYHEQAHVWEIPLQLANLCSDYSFYLRPHGAEGWDLLCYAVPKERLSR